MKHTKEGFEESIKDLNPEIQVKLKQRLVLTETGKNEPDFRLRWRGILKGDAYDGRN